MKSYIEAAQQAHKQLTPLLDHAIADANTNLAQAKDAGDRKVITQKLVAAINAAEKPHADAVPGILASYAGMLRDPGIHDGSRMIAALSSTVSVGAGYSITDKQAAIIAVAILAAVHGKAPLSLIEWPAADAWHTVMSFESLLRWAAWVAPAEHAAVVADMADAAKQLIQAEIDLLHLSRASQALGNLIPKPSSGEFVRIKNHAEHKQGAAGIRWQAGETLEVSNNDYVRLISHAGFKQLTEAGQFEIMA
ncbi:hypothetical protein [Pseudomonas sp.]|uniref:hypothetical protein n=1 Tax=Pseudomonas sp. TaxID=306 RepID=UPI0032635C93